jgi:carotenoid cleavage dioxygenase
MTGVWVILDARDFARGPIARVLLPHRISSGTHSCWADASEIETNPSRQGNRT